MLPAANTEFTYTVKDLGQIDFGGTPLAVIGHPVCHSVSPAMHNAAIAHLAKEDSRFRTGPIIVLMCLRKILLRRFRSFTNKTFLGLI